MSSAADRAEDVDRNNHVDQTAPQLPAEASIATIEALRAVAERADAGDETALSQVHRLLREWPQFAVLMLEGDPALTNCRALAVRLADFKRARTAATSRYIELTRQDLAGPECGPIERLLIEHVLHCWLTVLHLDRERDRSADEPVGHAAYRDRVRDGAHRRLLAALKTLAQVR